jgi:hypothetical protein
MGSALVNSHRILWMFKDLKKKVNTYGWLVGHYDWLLIDSLVIVISPCVGVNVKYPLTRGVSHCGLAIYIKKYLKAKEELWKLNYFTM